MRQPGLVNVDDALSLSEKFEHLLGIEHPGDQAALRVTLVLDLLEDAVSHVKILTKYLAHLCQRQVKIGFVMQDVLGLLRSPDMLAFLELGSYNLSCLR